MYTHTDELPFLVPLLESPASPPPLPLDQCENLFWQFDIATIARMALPTLTPPFSVVDGAHSLLGRA